MWLHITKIKTDPAKAEELIMLITNDTVVGAGTATGKLQESFVLQSTEDPGEIVSVSIWHNKQSGIAFFQGEAYAKLGQQMRSYLIAPPERAGYEIREMMQVYAGEILRYP